MYMTVLRLSPPTLFVVGSDFLSPATKSVSGDKKRQR
jgi:hypothetical protein